MRAIRVSSFGGPEVLKLIGDVPVPTVSKGQVRFWVRCSYNPIHLLCIHSKTLFILTMCGKKYEIAACTWINVWGYRIIFSNIAVPRLIPSLESLFCNHMTRRPCWGQDNRIFSLRISMKVELSSLRRENAFVLDPQRGCRYVTFKPAKIAPLWP